MADAAPREQQEKTPYEADREHMFFAADGSMMCETHPGQEWPHDDCAGPGMPWVLSGRTLIEDALRARQQALEQELAEYRQSLALCGAHTPDVWEGDGTCVLCEAVHQNDQLRGLERGIREVIKKWHKREATARADEERLFRCGANEAAAYERGKADARHLDTKTLDALLSPRPSVKGNTNAD